MTDVTELMKLVEQQKTLEAKIAEDQKTLKKVCAKILAICPHLMTVKKEFYAAGGYDYPEEYNTWDECTICNKRLNVKKKNGL